MKCRSETAIACLPAKTFLFDMRVNSVAQSSNTLSTASSRVEIGTTLGNTPMKLLKRDSVGVSQAKADVTITSSNNYQRLVILDTDSQEYNKEKKLKLNQNRHAETTNKDNKSLTLKRIGFVILLQIVPDFIYYK
ncbi:hypothetical protein BB561_003667 [Smittium simulii]|uniref:Uncharacterized protein n=1 Tax=Smittium simulii TaxID=133385 RepID=A0A2T9YK46_9FUNG|nr:hypothetical protein BB561_003667 [Smittium simulii]